MYGGLQRYGADGTLGPILPYYERKPPQWIIRGKFYERPSHPTGSILDWRNTRTGNVLLKKAIFRESDSIFREKFGRGGEDRDFFRRMIAKGFRFVWIAEAFVYEIVSPARFTRSFVLRRALLRGKIPHFTAKDHLKSLLAVPLYTALLPFLLFAGQHVFMKYLIKDFDHIGRILALLGIDVIKQKYVTE
jgi:hypothetical protein